MTTKHPRLNVTLSSELMGLLSMLAKKEDKSLSSIAGELLEEALEMREDIYFSKLAAEREKNAVWVFEDPWK
jgi:predicted DNA-binding protein